MRAMALEALIEGTAIRVEVDGEDVLLVRTPGRIYAVSNRCAHQGAPLDRGVVRATGSPPSVTCAAHGSTFGLEDGRVLRPKASTRIRTYDVRVDGDAIEVRPMT